MADMGGGLDFFGVYAGVGANGRSENLYLEEEREAVVCAGWVWLEWTYQCLEWCTFIYQVGRIRRGR